jgi:hypothetical protein
MTEERVFVVQPYTKREARLAGWSLLVVSLGAVAFFVIDGFDDTEQALTVLVAGGGLAAYGVYVVRTAGKPVARHTVVTSVEGLRIGEKPPIPWNEIDGLRATANGVDVLRGSERLGTVSKQLDDPVLAAGIVMKNIRFNVPSPQRSIRSRLTAGRAVNILLGALVLGACVWLIVRGSWAGYLGAAVIVWELIDDLRITVRRIDFDEHALGLRYLLHRRTIPRPHVRSFDVILDTKETYAAAFLADEQHVKLPVPGVDPFVIHETARRVWDMP